jgi:hypothetical protein
LETDIEAMYNGDPAAYSKAEKSVPENTRVSVRNPELQYKNNRNVSAYVELDQMGFWSYEI